MKWVLIAVTVMTFGILWVSGYQTHVNSQTATPNSVQKSGYRCPKCQKDCYKEEGVDWYYCTNCFSVWQIKKIGIWSKAK